jgi:hypothetical protein
MANVTNVLNTTWHNGSVYEGVNFYINLSNQNVTRLTFDSGLANFTNFAPTVAPLFDGSMFTYPVECAYAISGQYGILPRGLYYLLLVFALVLRRHIWLSTAALGTAMTYAATAAVHAIALSSKFKFHTHDADMSIMGQPTTFFGDQDIFGILPVLIAACIMLTPILNWSITVRQNEARPVVVYWGLLMFAATILVLIDIYGKDAHPLALPSIAACATDVPKGCSQDSIVKQSNLTFSSTFYKNCNCVDFCGTVVNNIPFRKTQNMQFNGAPNKAGKLSSSAAVGYIGGINILFIALVIIQGVFGLVESQWSQAEVRNWIFRKLTSSQLHDRFFKKLEKKSVPPVEDQSGIVKVYLTIARWLAIPFLATHRHFHHWLEDRPGMNKAYNVWKRFYRACLFQWAKWTAASIYVLALFLALICPPLLISSVIINEINLQTFPYGEAIDAVGQWGTWVGAFFVIFAAFVIRYNSAFWHSIGTGYSTVVRFFRFVRGKGPLRYDRETSSADSSLFNELKKFLHECGKPFTHAWTSTVHGWDRTSREVRDFYDWWRDPIQHSTWDWVGGESGWWEGNLNNQELFKSWDDTKGWKAFQGGQRSKEMTKKEVEDRKAERIAREKARKTRRSRKSEDQENPVAEQEKPLAAIDEQSLPTTRSDSNRTSEAPHPPSKPANPEEDTEAEIEAHATDLPPFSASGTLAKQRTDSSGKSTVRKQAHTRRDSELPALPFDSSDHEAPPTTGDSLSTEQGSFVPTALTTPPVPRRRPSDIAPPISIYNTQMARDSTASSRHSSRTQRPPSDMPVIEDSAMTRLDPPSD